ncbi:MAG: glycine cleavage system protein GcvH [Candidatus Hydrothermota bacterium]|nr:MAG: glycine cleavage system protein GcvH [Candidatus Hydrothermae bacterium]
MSEYKVPEDLKYTKEHEWAKIEGDVATIGITDYAQSELGDIVYIELPKVDSEVEQMAPIGTIEAVKTVADLYSPLSGKVIEVNEKLSQNPSIVNNDPYGEGWIAKIRISNPDEVKNLLSAEDYIELLEEVA